MALYHNSNKSNNIITHGYGKPLSLSQTTSSPKRRISSRRSRPLHLLVLILVFILFLVPFGILYYYYHALSLILHNQHEEDSKGKANTVEFQHHQPCNDKKQDTTTTTSATSTNNNSKNPLAIDCPSLLNDFLHGKVSEMELHAGFEKSYVTRTNTPKPFYWSTHKGELDMPRQIAFEKGEYYEQELTARVIEAYSHREGKDVDNDKDDDGIFLDVGGNIGWYSLVAASHGAKKVYTFEPNPSNVVRICESLRLNEWTNVVDVMMVGVSDTMGKQKLFKVDPNNPGMFSFDENRAKKFNHGNPEIVSGEFQLVTLDEFAQSMGWLDLDDGKGATNIRFFKLDVEGFEPKIIRGAQKLFRSRIVQLFAMEMKKKLHSDEDKKMITQLLFESGYELYREGAWKGPKRVIQKKYNKWEDLAQDIIDRKYGENLLFRRIQNHPGVEID